MKKKKSMEFYTTRNEIFIDMLKSIFTRADLKYDYINNEGKWEVSIGAGSDLVSDCKKSYSSEYKCKIDKIFEICLLDVNTCIRCFHNKSEIEFSRENVINNTIDYLIGLGINIGNPFKIESERYLLSKLIYKYIVQLLDVIFNVDSQSLVKERKGVGDDIIKNFYGKRISKLKKQVEKSDITSLIYSNAAKSDIEVVFDSDYDKSEYNYALCISLYNQRIDMFGNLMMITDVSYIEREKTERWYGINGYYQKIDSIQLTFCDWENPENKDQVYQQDWVHMISGFEKYPFPTNAVFKPKTYRKDIKRFEVINCDSYDYKLPHYIYFVTKLSKEELKKKYSSIYDNPNLKCYMEYKAIIMLKERYDFNEEKYSKLILDNILNFLNWISAIDHKSFFDINLPLKEYIITFSDIFLNLSSIFQFLKSHNADNKQAIIIFIYSVSVIIDNLCHYIENITLANCTSISEDYTATFRLNNAIMIKNNLSTEQIRSYADKIKAFLDSDKLSEMIELYREYYDVRKKELRSLENIIDNFNYGSTHSTIHNSIVDENRRYVPFEFLKSELEKLCEILNKILLMNENKSNNAD